MRIHDVRARRSADDFPRSEHLAWKIAEVAADSVAVPVETANGVAVRELDFHVKSPALEHNPIFWTASGAAASMSC